MRSLQRMMLSGMIGGAAALLLSWSQAQAQPNNAQITATANVLAPVTVTAQNDLDFGNVFPNVNSSVGVTDATAGQWQVAGEADAEVSLTLALPTDLTDGGGNTLPIVFAAGDAAHHTSNDASSATGFDPSAGTTAQLDAGTGDLFVWIGGTVQPDVAQTAGNYTGSITLTVDYTGN